MGRMLIEAIQNAPDARLAGALDIPGSPALGADATAYLGVTSGIVITPDLHEGLKNAKYLIDFTRPEGTLAHLRVCRELGVNMIIGTTGFTAEQKAEIDDATFDSWRTNICASAGTCSMYGTANTMGSTRYR